MTRGTVLPMEMDWLSSSTEDSSSWMDHSPYWLNNSSYKDCLGFFFFFCVFVDGMGVTTKIAAKGGWDGENDKWYQILWFCIQTLFQSFPGDFRESEREKEGFFFFLEWERWKVGVSFLKRGVAVLDKLLIDRVMGHEVEVGGTMEAWKVQHIQLLSSHYFMKPKIGNANS